MKFLVSLSLVLSVGLFAHGQESVVDYLQNISVTIRSGRGEGSGVITKIGEWNYVLTAGHVVDDLRKEREVIDPKTGTRRTVIEFEDAQVLKDLTEDGRKVGEVKLLAEVLRYSNANTGEDLALLKVRKKNAHNERVKFHLGETPKLGTELYHVGSLLGFSGSNSLTTGIYSQVGRLHNGIVYDQTTCAAFPGSSGGGVFMKGKAEYVGMVVRGAGETFNLIVPVRRIHKWSERVGVDWVLNSAKPVPSDDEIRSVPIEEERGTGRFSRESASKPALPPGKP